MIFCGIQRYSTIIEWQKLCFVNVISSRRKKLSHNLYVDYTILSRQHSRNSQSHEYRISRSVLNEKANTFRGKVSRKRSYEIYIAIL